MAKHSFKPHRPAGIHPAYRVHGVDHHSKMEHHPGKTHSHPTNPGMSEAAPAPSAPMPQGTSPGMSGNMDQDGEGGPGY